MWDVEFTDTFGSWWEELNAADQERITAAVEILEQAGPALGRPLVDTIKASRHANMKDRDLAARRRQARGWQEWYRENVPAADAVYDQHLRTLREEGTIK